MVLPFGPPYPVSPLIRGLRWTFLLAGIVYGRIKQKIYDVQEANWREEEAQKKPIRDRQIAIMKARIAREEREFVNLLEPDKFIELDVIKPVEEKKHTVAKEAKKECKYCDEGGHTCDCKE